MIGTDAEIHYFVQVCYSDYSMYFEWTLYIIEGALLCFGAFLSFETRHVSQLNVVTTCYTLLSKMQIVIQISYLTLPVDR